MFRPDQQAFDAGASWKKRKAESDCSLDLSKSCPSPPLKSPSISRVTGQRTAYTPLIPHAQSIKNATPRSYHNTPECSGQKDDGITYFEREFAGKQRIGGGCFGAVYRVQSRSNGELYAIKEAISAYKGNQDRTSKLKEVYNLDKLNHPHCVCFVQAWEEKAMLYIQMELCELGDLKQYMRFRAQNRLTDEEILNYLVDLLSALQHIHAANLMHLDVSPDNIFLSCAACRLQTRPGSKQPPLPTNNLLNDRHLAEHRNHIVLKIGDYGVAIKAGTWNGEDGANRYLAPEILKHKLAPNGQAVGQSADMFALGAVMLEMLAGAELPNEGQGYQDLRQGHIPNLPERSPELQEIVKSMMYPDPLQRPTATRLLNHPLLAAILKDRSANPFYQQYYTYMAELRTPVQNRAAPNPIVSISPLQLDMSLEDLSSVYAESPFARDTPPPLQLDADDSFLLQSKDDISKRNIKFQRRESWADLREEATLPSPADLGLPPTQPQFSIDPSGRPPFLFDSNAAAVPTPLFLSDQDKARKRLVFANGARGPVTPGPIAQNSLVGLPFPDVDTFQPLVIHTEPNPRSKQAPRKRRPAILRPPNADPVRPLHMMEIAAPASSSHNHNQHMQMLLQQAQNQVQQQHHTQTIHPAPQPPPPAPQQPSYQLYNPLSSHSSPLRQHSPQQLSFSSPAIPTRSAHDMDLGSDNASPPTLAVPGEFIQRRFSSAHASGSRIPTQAPRTMSSPTLDPLRRNLMQEFG